MKTYPKEILEIHNEFNTAGDKILANALEILNKTGACAIEKSERLKKIGFTNANEVKAVEDVTSPLQLAQLTQHYNIRYPNNKFITEDQVYKICVKYKLACAPIGRYKGFVPETKLKQIESFRLWSEDEKERQIINVQFEFSMIQQTEQKSLLKKYPNGVYPFSELRSRNHLGEDRVNISSYDIIDNTGLLICAPKKDMDLKGLKKVGAILQSFVTVTVPDPVVLQPVKGGFLILAAWGDEASDEIVVNQKFN